MGDKSLICILESSTPHISHIASISMCVSPIPPFPSVTACFLLGSPLSCCIAQYHLVLNYIVWYHLVLHSIVWCPFLRFPFLHCLFSASQLSNPPQLARHSDSSLSQIEFLNMADVRTWLNINCTNVHGRTSNVHGRLNIKERKISLFPCPPSHPLLHH